MDRKEYLAKPNQTLEEHVNELLANLDLLYDYGYIDKRIYELLKMACIYHDDGKTNPEFQKRIRNNSNFNDEIEIPHNVLSCYLLDPKLFNSNEDYYEVLYAILYHHDYVDITPEYIKLKKPLINDLLKGYETHNLTRKTLQNISELIKSENPESIKIKGLLNKCDYSASGHYQIEYPNNFLVDSLENIKNKWKKYNLNADWNDVQNFCIKNRDKNLLVVAQTGMGKTEAGLQWIGNHKGFFVIPLRTANNAIYNRISKEILNEENVEEKLSLLHSESLSYYINNVKDNEDKVDVIDYEKRGKNLSMPLSVSTADQLISFVFKGKGYELKLATLSYSKIVIDEIQMYDPKLLADLIMALSMITNAGGKINIMTATLAPFLKDIIKKYIHIDDEGVFVNEQLRHNIKTIKKQLTSNDIIDFYHNKKEKESCKLLVICNTVKKAQEIYNDLKNNNIENVHILHSRFTKKDRQVLESQIKEFGKTYDDNKNIDKNNGIWITTQVVEASLDIDFDYLFTELQDLTSLIQRLGRCNRKGLKDISEINCFIYTIIDEKLITPSITGNAFIDPDLYFLSKKAIESVNGIISEKEKIDLINRFLTTENLKNSNYLKRFYDEITFINSIYVYQYEKGENRLRNILSEQVIPSSIYKKFKDTIDELVEYINDSKNPYIKRVKKESKLNEYTVSVPEYYVSNYKKAVNAGTAEFYTPINIKNNIIYILECQYDESGLTQIKFEKEKKGAMIL